MAEAMFCAHCGAPREGEDVFCGRCGTRFPDDAAVAATPPAMGVPPTQVPPQAPVAPVASAPPPPISVTVTNVPAGVPVAATPAPTARIQRRPAVGGMAFVGALAMAVGSFIPWVRPTSATGFDIPISVVFGSDLAGSAGFSAGLFVLLLALVGGLLSFVPAASGLRRVAGGLAVLVAIAFVGQLSSAIEQLGSTESLGDLLGVGPVVVGIGGLFLAFARRRPAA